MASTQLLSVCVLISVQFALPQFTHDTTGTDANSCGSSEQMIHQLMTANSQLIRANAQLINDVAQLQKDVAQLKTGSRQKNINDCPANFTYLPAVNGGCYVAVNENRNWEDAGTRCRSLHKDAHLLAVNDAAEQSAIEGMLQSIDRAAFSGCTAIASTGTYFWTAGHRVQPTRNSAFVWRMKSSDPSVESVSLMTYTNWHPGQPDFFNRRQSCMLLWPLRSYTWDDGHCTFQACFVCEIDI